MEGQRPIHLDGGDAGEITAHPAIEWDPQIGVEQQGVEKLLAELTMTAPEFPVAIPAEREVIDEYRFGTHELNRLVPVDNSLIFINFMNRLRAKRTDSLTNRFFLLSIRPV